VHFLVSHFVRGCSEGAKGITYRLAVRSLLEDGEFVRGILKQLNDDWLGKFEDCLKAAARAGERQQVPVRADLGFWFTHHGAGGLMMHLHARVPAIDYHVPRPELVEQAVWFALLGMGLRNQAIKRHYNPRALSLMVE